ncbi:unnamed protein product [Acanthosepion pharaonis]|uniref:Uncharacterized protein n=1 Tax=Acanthosepion pharaonis TaxID=158019 RepID=A0A812CA88_ACAPH|nr:unnamed protein product [Sepia pharaonis]
MFLFNFLPFPFSSFYNFFLSFTLYANLSFLNTFSFLNNLYAYCILRHFFHSPIPSFILSFTHSFIQKFFHSNILSFKHSFHVCHFLLSVHVNFLFQLMHFFISFIFASVLYVSYNVVVFHYFSSIYFMTLVIFFFFSLFILFLFLLPYYSFFFFFSIFFFFFFFFF